MAVPSRTLDIDDLYATTSNYRMKKDTDQIFTATPLRKQMLEKKKFDTQEGGRRIEVRVSYAKNETTDWFGRGGTVSIARTPHLTMAYYEWRYLSSSIVRYLSDDQKNRGQSQLIKAITADLDNARSSISDVFETALFASQTGDSINGLKDIVADAPATGTVGGFNRATYSWWRNNFESMSGEDVPTKLRRQMNNMFNDCGKYADGVQRFPDINITAQDVYEAYEDELVEIKQITSNQFADLGFGDLVYKGRPIVWSPACPDGRMYMLNTQTLGFITDPGYFYQMGEWKEPADQPGTRVCQIVTACNFVCSAPNRNGVIFDISPPTL